MCLITWPKADWFIISSCDKFETKFSHKLNMMLKDLYMTINTQFCTTIKRNYLCIYIYNSMIKVFSCHLVVIINRILSTKSVIILVCLYKYLHLKSFKSYEIIPLNRYNLENDVPILKRHFFWRFDLYGTYSYESNSLISNFSFLWMNVVCWYQYHLLVTIK